jgi:hypothetical protein
MTSKNRSSFRRVGRTMAALIAMVLIPVSCRFGGPTSSSESLLPDGGVAGDGDPDGPPLRGRLDAPAEPSALPDDGRSDGPPPTCDPPFLSAVCDPICNTGCPALSRCDVSDLPQTGACVGIWVTQEGDACFKGDTTDACAAHLTCLEGKCHRLCYRDSDCTTPGACCTRDIEAAGAASGFKACAPCPP